MTANDVWILILGGVIGLVASVIASMAYTVGLRRLQPNIRISDVIALHDGTHRVKVVNSGPRDAVDVSVHVYIEQLTPMPGGVTNQTRSRVGTRFSLEVIPARSRASRKDGRARYARLVRLDADFDAKWRAKGTHFPILFVVVARDAISGVTKTFEKRYGEPSISVRAGRFETGDSLAVF